MSLGGSEVATTGRDDPELARHLKKFSTYERLEEWARRFGMFGLPLAKYFGARKRAHERAYERVVKDY